MPVGTGVTVFKKKKLSPIERRLEELQKEMSSVNQNLKTVTRTAPAPAGTSGVKQPPFHDRPASASEPAAHPPGVPAGSGGVEPDAGELFAYGAKTPVASSQPGELFAGLPAKGVSQARTVPLPVTHAQRSGREKFAHYFMAGHFANLRPSRQESRVVRNKAILMLIAVLIALAWLVWYLRSH